MFNDPKTKYLYAVEAGVIALVGLDGLRQFSTGLRDGMWCNAHMYHGLGLDADLAAVKFVNEVIAVWHPWLITDRDLAVYLHYDA